MILQLFCETMYVHIVIIILFAIYLMQGIYNYTHKLFVCFSGI
jgi:hypothetical protein